MNRTMSSHSYNNNNAESTKINRIPNNNDNLREEKTEKYMLYKKSIMHRNKIIITIIIRWTKQNRFKPTLLIPIH